MVQTFQLISNFNQQPVHFATDNILFLLRKVKYRKMSGADVFLISIQNMLITASAMVSLSDQTIREILLDVTIFFCWVSEAVRPFGVDIQSL